MRDTAPILRPKASPSKLKYGILLRSLSLHEFLQSFNVLVIVPFYLLGDSALLRLRGVLCDTEVLLPVILVSDAFVIHHKVILGTPGQKLRGGTDM